MVQMKMEQRPSENSEPQAESPASLIVLVVQQLWLQHDRISATSTTTGTETPDSPVSLDSIHPRQTVTTVA